MLGAIEKAHVVVLPGDIDDPLERAGENPDGDQGAVDVRLAAPISADQPAHADFIAQVRQTQRLKALGEERPIGEHALDACLLFARADDVRTGAPAQEET